MNSLNKLSKSIGIVLMLSMMIGAFLFLTPSSTAKAILPVKPNIIFLIVDDLDTTTLNAAIPYMPNFQQLVANGTKFTRAYVSDPRGCPTRESYWTGISFLHLQPGNQTQCGVSIFDDSNNIGVWMQRAGYFTSVIGKTFDGSCYTDCNHDGIVDMKDTAYISPGWNNWQALQYDQPLYTGQPPPNVVVLGQDNPNQYNYFLNDNGTLRYYKTAPSQYQGDVLRTMMTNSITTATSRNQPFFIHAATGAPHVETLTDPAAYDTYTDAWKWMCHFAPWFVSSHSPALSYQNAINFNEYDLSDKPLWVRQKSQLSAKTNDFANLSNQFLSRVYATASTVDPMIGDMVNAMSPAQRANTVWIITSDNGWQYGSHRLTGKLDAYEESINVPLYVSVGGGVVSGAMIKAEDFAPTIMELAGGSIPHAVDGKSFVSLLTGNPNQPWRNRMLALHSTAMAGTPGQLFDMPPYQAVRTGPNAHQTPDQLYVMWTTGEREFYDMPTDPGQMVSRHNSTDSIRQIQMRTLQKNISDLSSCGVGQCQAIEFAP